jgi:hypothetical protein
MKLSVRAMTVTGAILWGGSVFCVALANLLWPPYGAGFLQLLASVYPGYAADTTFGGLMNVTLYALVDGAVGGLVFAGLYNLIAAKCDGKHKDK